MKKIVKHFSFLTTLVALFALLTVAAYADETPKTPDVVFATETQLTVYVDNQWSSTLSGSYGFGDTATITAPDVSGKTFSHWTAGGSIVSYDKSLNLTMNAHTTLYAVYASAAPTEKPVAGFTSVTRTNDGTKISFQAIASDDTAGIIYSTTTTGDALIIGGTGVTDVNAVKLTGSETSGTMPQSVLDGNNCWILQITPDSGDTVYHARAYVTVGGNATYGDEKTVKLSDLSSGISLIANPGSIDPETDLDDALKNLTIYTVTFEPNGGVGATITQAFVSGQSVTLRANTFTRSGYTFNGWRTEPSGGTSYKDGDTVTLTADTTLYAQWRSNSSGGGNYSGGGTPTATTVTVPVSGDDETVNVKVEVKGDTATITSADVDKVLEAEDVGTVTIDVSALKQAVTEVVIPGAMVEKIADAVADEDNNADGLEIKLPTGTVSFDADAVATIAEQTEGKDLTLNLDDVKVTELSSEQQDAVKELQVEAVLDAYLTSNGQRISDFGGGKATVSVPYELKDDQIAQGLVVWYVADDGTKTQVPSTYDGKNIVFTVTHFSNYVVAYDAEKAAACPQDDTCPMSAFTDLNPALWYHDGIHFCLENGMMNGVGNNKFDPSGTTSRGMIVTILYRLENEPEITAENPFDDVEADRWYTNAVIWAAENKIVSGYGDGKFGPDDTITREQLAVILYRYAQFKGIDVSVGEDTNILAFEDAGSWSDWSVSALQWAVGSGIINGKDGKLVPKGDASRAEAATMLQRFCENVK